MKNFVFLPPWGDCHALWLLKTNDANERPPPPRDAHESLLKRPVDYPHELARLIKNVEIRAKKKLKEDAKHAENVKLM